MKKYRIVIPPIVQEQIFSQVMYIARNSVNNALAWEERVRGAIQNIATLPIRYPIDGAATARMGRDIRKIVFERNYLIFYCIDETTRSVDVVNFRHGARLPRHDEP